MTDFGSHPLATRGAGWRWMLAAVVCASLQGCAVLHIAAQPGPADPRDPRAAVRDLPLEWVAPADSSRGVTAVLLTGDGGWASLIANVARGLSAQGVAVVGFNSRRWLSRERTPEETSLAIVRAIDAARAQWPANQLVLVGYSRGADFAPFVANRLPARLKRELRGMALFGLAPMASFEFHLVDLVKDTRRDSDVPMMPELERLRGLRMVCVYGNEEPTSGCRDAPTGLLRTDARSGGHHFDGNAEALVAHVLWLLAPIDSR